MYSSFIYKDFYGRAEIAEDVFERRSFKDVILKRVKNPSVGRTII
jgi:hypothetical protein